jgi:hypothetical protein
VDVPPIRTNEEEQHIDLKIESFGMSMISGDELIKKGAGELETKNWDDKDSINSDENLPLVDLSSEE